MKKLLVFLLFLVQISVYCQTKGSMERRVYDDHYNVISKELYGYNVTILPYQDKYEITYKAVGAFGADLFKLEFVKNTSNGKRYRDQSKGDFYIEDNIETLGTLTLKRANLNSGKIEEFYFYNLNKSNKYK